MIRILLSILIGTSIVGGQICLAALARKLVPPWTPLSVVSQVLMSPWAYVAVVLYVAAIGTYLGMLRHYPISMTNVPIMAVVVILNLMIAFTPSEALGAMQIAGALCVGLGILLMMSG